MSIVSAKVLIVLKSRDFHLKLFVFARKEGKMALGPNKHGLVTYMQVNVYIGNTLSWLNGG